MKKDSHMHNILLSVSLMVYIAPLIGMEGLKQRLNEAIQNKDRGAGIQCCEDILSHLFATKPLGDYTHYCPAQKKEYYHTLYMYIPGVNIADISIRDELVQQCKRSIKDSLQALMREKEQLLKQRQKNKYCLNMITIGLAAFASGFLVGVYEYGVC